MNITISKLKQLIKEELSLINEGKLTQAEKTLLDTPDSKLSADEKEKKNSIQHK